MDRTVPQVTTRTVEEEDIGQIIRAFALAWAAYVAVALATLIAAA